MKQVYYEILNELKEVAKKIDDKQIEAFVQDIQPEKRIFVTGDGRSGLMGKAFAMRLMHAGYQVFVVGETITPSFNKDDVLVVISGSGNTKSSLVSAEQAHKLGTKLLLVTAASKSQLGELADSVVRLPAATKQRLLEEPNTIQPLGNQFDQSVHLFLDSVVILLTKDKANINDYMKNQHANY
ncbi:6-phospho-3-hexuloisomerase [Aquibacillus sp. 3ASR75-11]|uniref:6-phospho-3-hexuloisomerase n=1 Tax=Terrihalobacillus insolitus TaxID=2950438 RepID=A0A9X4AM93_9BACI|nr:6-phospho-3-hexuloisomerase [Terrihalobacillus insolitus]MDC3412057.1 6-phospho-3-hexuloisomerase [Terrihalobacillus insolitus]MDC3423250.1 6-phospho-3-hexuloisomerase [Terrihalobacillus insolitus]